MPDELVKPNKTDELEALIIKSIHDHGISSVSGQLMDLELAERICHDNNLRCDFWDTTKIYDFRKDNIRAYTHDNYHHTTLHTWKDENHA